MRPSSSLALIQLLIHDLLVDALLVREGKPHKEHPNHERRAASKISNHEGLVAHTPHSTAFKGGIAANLTAERGTSVASGAWFAWHERLPDVTPKADWLEWLEDPKVEKPKEEREGAKDQRRAASLTTARANRRPSWVREAFGNMSQPSSLGESHVQEGPRSEFQSAEGMVAAWTALGENWWMSFIDGRDHAFGPNAYEDSSQSKANGQDGKYLENCRREYKLWSDIGKWALLSKTRWRAEDLAALSMQWGGKACKANDCSEAYGTQHVCHGKVDPPLWTEHCVAMARKYGYEEYDHRLQLHQKEPALRKVLADYYDAVDAAHNNLDAAFPHLVRLYTALAAIHPFIDGNSRTRLFVLQTELVRLGGHPIMIEGSKAVYEVAPTHPAHEKLILDGWCMFEAAVKTGRSPYVHTGDAIVYEKKSRSCQPNATVHDVASMVGVSSNEIREGTELFGVRMSSWADSS